MQPLTPAVVAYGLLFAMPAHQDADIETQPACNVEEFGLDEHCHDCMIFHTQMLEDGVNLTTRCGWPPEGSDQRTPSELANRYFSVGRRPICESCSDFYQRLLGGSPPFNLTEKCGWQLAASILDESSPPSMASRDMYHRQLEGSPPFNLTDESGWQTTSSIRNDSSPPTMASYAGSGACLVFTVCVVSVGINVVTAIYCCLLRCRNCIRNPPEYLTTVVISSPNGSPPKDDSSDAKGTPLLEDTDCNRDESSKQSQLNGRSCSPTKFSNSSKSRKKNNLRNRKRKTVPSCLLT